MSKKPWMPLYIADYLKDTTHLGAMESGAYLHLIMDYWTNGGLPSDDRQLARIAKMTDREWKKSKPVLHAFFHDGWKHKRIDQELAHASQVSSKRSAIAAARQAAIREQAECKDSAIAPAKAHTLHTSQRKEEAPSGASSKVYAFESGVIRLNQRDFDLWKANFSHLDLGAELIALTDWAAAQRSWFNAVSGALAKRNREVKANKEKPAETYKWNGIEGVL